MKRAVPLLALLLVTLAAGSAASPAMTAHPSPRDTQVEAVKDRLRSMIDHRLDELEAIRR